jgi:hypothetical protein
MKTDELIAALAADTTPVAARAAERRLGLSSLVGVGAALVLLIAWLGLRPDLTTAVRSGPFWMKAAYTAAAALAGFVLTDRLARPGVRLGLAAWLPAGVLAAIAGLAVVDLMRTPAAARGAEVMGHTWTICAFRILIISVPAFASIVWGLRRLAPTRLRLSGAAAGLLAGGLGATVYGLFCRESAAAFVAVWYTLGLILCAGAGALTGPRLLRW